MKKTLSSKEMNTD